MMYKINCLFVIRRTAIFKESQSEVVKFNYEINYDIIFKNDGIF